MKIREIQPEDKDKVLKSFKPIFASWDYLPFIIDDWLIPSPNTNTWIVSSDNNEIFVIIAQSQFLNENTVYLRGLRSNPKASTKEVSQGVIKLTQLLRKKFENTQVKKIKFRTLETFQASKRIASLFGFTQELRIAHNWHKLEEINEQNINNSINECYETLQIEAFDNIAYDYAKSSSFVKLCYGNIFTWWDFREFSQQEFASAAKNGFAIVAKNSTEILGVSILTHVTGINFLILSILACADDDALKTLFLHAYKKSKELNCAILGLAHPDINKLYEIQATLGLIKKGVHSLQFSLDMQKK